MRRRQNRKEYGILFKWRQKLGCWSNDSGGRRRAIQVVPPKNNEGVWWVIIPSTEVRCDFPNETEAFSCAEVYTRQVV